MYVYKWLSNVLLICTLFFLANWPYQRKESYTLWQAEPYQKVWIRSASPLLSGLKCDQNNNKKNCHLTSWEVEMLENWVLFKSRPSFLVTFRLSHQRWFTLKTITKILFSSEHLSNVFCNVQIKCLIFFDCLYFYTELF